MSEDKIEKKPIKQIKEDAEQLIKTKLLQQLNNEKERLKQLEAAIEERIVYIQQQDPQLQYLFGTKNEILNQIKQLENLYNNI